MQHLAARFMGLALIVALSGCASFDGMPEPIFKADATVAQVNARYAYDDVVDAIADKDDADDRKVYRNRVAAAYMMAIDARYFAFRRGLSRGMKGGNIGFDVALLSLTGSAAIWEKAADELAAIATGVAGARASFNRELYFERTLPALITIMEAKRLEARSTILRGLVQTEDEYTVQELFADLHMYEGAAGLDGAIQTASEIAAATKANAKYDYSRAVELCEAGADVVTARKAFMRELEDGRKTPAGRARYARAAASAGVKDAEATAAPDAVLAQQQAIADYLRGICAIDLLDKFKADVGPEK
jgi:hypothetical protein